MHFFLNGRYLDLMPLLEKEIATLIYSFLDTPNPLIRNISVQPFEFKYYILTVDYRIQGTV